MKRITEMLSKRNLGILMLLVGITIFVACNKDDDDPIYVPQANMMAFNLAVDQPAVVVTLDNNQLGNAAIGYGGYTGTYLPIFTGSRMVKSFGASNVELASTQQTFNDSSYYSVFVVGDSGMHTNMVVMDDYTNVVPVSGKAWVRYVNAIPDSMVMPTMQVGEMSETVEYGDISDFQQVNTGALDITLTGDAMANRTINVEENKIYTVLFMGLPNQTDTTKAVQIRYIENGTATN